MSWSYQEPDWYDEPDWYEDWDPDFESLAATEMPAVRAALAIAAEPDDDLGSDDTLFGGEAAGVPQEEPWNAK